VIMEFLFDLFYSILLLFAWHIFFKRILEAIWGWGVFWWEIACN
jgi:hypothetical protein